VPVVRWQHLRAGPDGLLIPVRCCFATLKDLTSERRPFDPLVLSSMQTLT
jgi:hypothetical protein